MDIYTIQLKPSDDEAYAEQNQHIMRIRVQLPDGRVESNSNYNVYLEMTKDARIGLGTYLIRSALGYEEDFVEAYPYEYPVEYAGAIIHPDSCRYLILPLEAKSLDEVFSSEEE